MDIAIEVLRAIGRLFMNPLLYIALFSLVLLGYVRVKRERKYFKIRILGGWTELRLGINSLLAGLVISIFTVGLGMALPLQFLLVVMLLSVLFVVLQLQKLLSPVIVFALSFLLLIGMQLAGDEFSLFGVDVFGERYDTPVVTAFTIIAGMLVIVEGLKMKKHGAQLGSPILERTRRGGRAVAYLSKGLWIVPVFIVIPGDVIPVMEPYFPRLALGDDMYSLLVFPFVVGFKQLTRTNIPSQVYATYSKAVLVLGQITIIGGIASYFDALVGVITLLVCAVLRIVIALVVMSEQRKGVYAVVAKPYGTMIAAVLPNSPAEKMGLLPGEVIKRVNGQEVLNERELYEALQINAALCKLEVLDYENELRLTQHVVHSEDHHRIGVLLAETK